MSLGNGSSKESTCSGRIAPPPLSTFCSIWVLSLLGGAAHKQDWSISVSLLIHLPVGSGNALTDTLWNLLYLFFTIFNSFLNSSTCFPHLSIWGTGYTLEITNKLSDPGNRKALLSAWDKQDVWRAAGQRLGGSGRQRISFTCSYCAWHTVGVWSPLTK
jgi:hypothetical protein